MKATRLLPAFAAAAALVLAPGLGLADPGNGKGNGITNNPNVPPAQSTQDTSAPQPPSNADFSGSGANVSGPYDSTRDGSPSLNGNGGGEAVGKPCAGCVGKADNKNPPGQMPPTTPSTPPKHPPSTKTEVPPPPGGGAPQAPEAQAASADELAFTGFDVLPLGLGGLALLGAGGATVLMARRTRKS
jgi:hypothetical protein